MKKHFLLVFGTAAVLIAAFAAAAWWYKGEEVAQQVEVAARNESVFHRADTPSLGPLMARAQITEFFDPACEGCRAFHPHVKRIVGMHAGKVRLVLRYAPFHEGSEYVVKVLEAARMQGDDVYWRAVDAVLDAQPVWADHGRPQPERVWEFLGGTGLDVERARKDMDDPRIAALIARDLADIEALNVRRTPTFFVNGQPLRDFGPEGLNAQVVEAFGR